MTINGITIKGLKKSSGHEGGYCQGTVYLDGKKLGFWSQDAWGGPDSYDSTEMYEKLAERAKSYQSGFPDSYKFKDVLDSPDVLLGELVQFMDEEKTYKKYAKQGYPVMLLVATNYSCAMQFFRQPQTDAVYAQCAAKLAERFKGKPYQTAVFTDISEFNLVCDAEHPIDSKFFRP